MIGIKQISAPAPVKSLPLNRTLEAAARQLGRAALQGLWLVGGFGLLLALWQVLSILSKDLPGPLPTLSVLWQLVSNPFYDNGPNDKGIGIQVLYSLGRVFSGWLIGSLVAIPLGPEPFFALR